MCVCVCVCVCVCTHQFSEITYVQQNQAQKKSTNHFILKLLFVLKMFWICKCFTILLLTCNNNVTDKAMQFSSAVDEAGNFFCLKIHALLVGVGGCGGGH